MEIVKEIGTNNLFTPESSAGKVLIPLLDSLNWKGHDSKLMEALVPHPEKMDTGGLVETLANLNFKHVKMKKVKGKDIDVRILPILYVRKGMHFLILNKSDDGCLVFDGSSGAYTDMKLSDVLGTMYTFTYVDENGDSLLHPQENWFNKLMFRFIKSFKSLVGLSFLIAVLDLMMPLFVVLIYDRVLSSGGIETIAVTAAGVVLYVAVSLTFSSMRLKILNYVGSRMGAIISEHTFKRLMFLSPTYTESASLNSQVSRIKDFDNLKNFVTGGSFVSLFDLAFSFIYIAAIFIIGGPIGIIPIVTLVVLIAIGFIMRPYHKIIMEKVSDSAANKQQSLIEILRHTDEIKVSGSGNTWLERYRKFAGLNVYNNYKLADYISLTNNISFFITNLSVLILLYGSVLQVLSGKMSTGILIGVLMLYWKVTGPIRGAFSMSVQINGILKSISQINRFMRLPLDSHLSTVMTQRKDIHGNVRFQDVSIKYNSVSKPALVNVSFKNESGKILGITGHDGAGKTTILKLILDMYEPQGGRVLIDNANIKQLEPLALRRSISYAPEKDMLFSGTVRENFKCYCPGISDEEIMNLCEKTGLREMFLKFGFNLDSEIDEKKISEMSLTLKKLFNITRMLTRDVTLYLIDEPENYLDRTTIEKVMEIVFELAVINKAGVIISTKDEYILSKCHNVILLNQGRVEVVEEAMEE